MNMHELADYDMERTFCNTADFGVACSIIGHDGKTFSTVAALDDGSKELRESGMQTATGRDVRAMICGLRNADPEGDRLADAWGRDIEAGDKISIATTIDRGVWTVLYATKTNGGNYDARIRQEELLGTGMRNQ